MESTWAQHLGFICLASGRTVQRLGAVSVVWPIARPDGSLSGKQVRQTKQLLELLRATDTAIKHRSRSHSSHAKA